MSTKDKKARRAALRDFLVAVPETFARATVALRWLVVLGALALAALLVFAAFGHDGHRPPPPPGGSGDNPSGALFVRDLGRLPDGRHTFDLVYDLVLRNADGRPVAVTYRLRRLSIGDPPPAGDVVDLDPAPGAYGAASGAWHALSSHRDTAPAGAAPDLAPGQWQALRAHYRINARPDQFADIAIGYGLRHERGGWFDRAHPTIDDAHDEAVQLGAVLRAHCPLGVKIHNGEMTTLCAH
ncbi:hypothetical protein [Novosphingobium sp.]|uniref:hypothetical protein n=1 Tax=Novosphingobium sp. TaxID=1874826 RepID=UPI00333FC65F